MTVKHEKNFESKKNKLSIGDRMSKSLVSKEDIQYFQQNGVVCLRNVLNPEQINILREGKDFFFLVRSFLYFFV